MLFITTLADFFLVQDIADNSSQRLHSKLFKANLAQTLLTFFTVDYVQLRHSVALMLLFMSALLNLMPLALIIVCAGNPSNDASTDSCNSSCAKAANLLQKKVFVSDKQVMWLSAMSLGSLCTEAETYIDQYELAVLSWRETNNSAFDPHLMIHLPHNMTLMTLSEFNQRRIKRIEQLGVRVVFHTLSFIDDLKSNLHQLRPDGDLDADCVAGSFLRLEVPKIIAEKHLLQPRHNQDYVLWTDCDIMWWRRVSMEEFMANIPSQKFSLAFSGQAMKDQRPENTGVMLMALKNYQEDMPKVVSSVKVTTEWGLDQAIIRRYYQKHTGLSGWSVIWNYRIFWDGNEPHEPPAIIHFWGLKPSKGLECWMQRRSMEGCPGIGKGLIPENSRHWMQMQAIKIAMNLDPQLIFMKKALERRKGLLRLQG